VGQSSIQEICQSLEGFYPDPDERHKAHYLFAHRFLPEYFFLNPRGVMAGAYLSVDCTKFVQARWQMMEYRAGLVAEPPRRARPLVFRRVTDVVGWSQTIGPYPALCVGMPQPERSPQAYSIAAVLLVSASEGHAQWPQDAAGRFFTLEKTPDRSEGLLCEWTIGGEHRNLALLVPPTAAGLVEALARILETG
jgi:hypothetical protein